MGLLGLRKFIDSCGCTRLLPVPVSDAEAEEEAMRRLRVEGYHEVTEDEGDAYGNAGGVYYEDTRGAKVGSAGGATRQRGLTSSSHMNGSSVAAAAAAAATAQATATPVVDHVLVDMNCIVHSCFHHQSSENKTKKQLIQEVLERLRVLVTEVVVPRQSLSICFDGPAPIAKLQTQRLRRRKVSLLDTGSSQQLNTLSITAGSLFMIELENAIASQFKLNHGRGFLRRVCPVYLYGTTVMGEGEAKISRALAFLAYGPAPAAAEGGEELNGSTPHAGARGHNRHGGRPSNRHATASAHAEGQNGFSGAPSHRGGGPHPYNPDDTVVVLGNDIDLVVTCLGATAYHNLSIVSPSSLQLIRVSDVIYRWLKATSATRGDAPFSPAQLPSIRIDFIYLFLLNGGDHYVGAGEVAMSLWKRYRSVRAAYPYSTLVSPTLDAIDIDFLADVVQASEYTGSSSVEVGKNLLQSALWSLYTVVTGVCPDYNYVPEPEAPQLCHLRAAAAHCQRTHHRIRLADFNAHSQPLTPLETYVALMPTEATLPKSIVAGLHSKPAYQSILKTLETSNDTAMIAQAARDAVEVSTPFLTTSEQYLRHFTSPVQLNVVPPRRRLSRHEQHRMMATLGHIQVEDPVPVVKPIAMAGEVPYMEVPYSAHTTYLDFCCPLDARANAQEGGAGAAAAGGAEYDDDDNNGGSREAVAHVQGRAVTTRPSLLGTAVSATTDTAAGSRHKQFKGGAVPQRSAAADGVEHKRVYLHQEEAAREQQQRERQSASAKLQRTLDVATSILQQGKHFNAQQERRMRRRLHRLQAAETEELRSQLAKEDKKYAQRDKSDAAALEDELLRFLGDDASPDEVKALLAGSANAAAKDGKKSSTSKKATKKALAKGENEKAGGKKRAARAVEVSEEEGNEWEDVAPRNGKKRAREEGDGDDASSGGKGKKKLKTNHGGGVPSTTSLHLSSEAPARPRSGGDKHTRAAKQQQRKQR